MGEASPSSKMRQHQTETTIDEENRAVLYFLQCKNCTNEEAEALIRVDGLDECYCPACDSEWVAPPPNDWMDKDYDVDEMRYV